MKLKIKKLKFKKINFRNAGSDIKNVSLKLVSIGIVRFLILFAVLILLNFISQRYFFRIDLTESKNYTLAQASKNIVSKLDENLTIDVYMSENIPPTYLPIRQNIIDSLLEYKRIGNGKVIVNIKNPNSDSFKTEATANGLYEAQFPARSADKYEVSQGYFGLNMTYKDKKDSIVFLTEENLEYELSSRIYKLINTELPTVGMLSGHGEKGQVNEYSAIVQYLKTQYNVLDVNFSAGEPIDAESIKTLIIASPTEQFSDRDMFELDQYIMQGGKIIVLAESYSNNLEAFTLTKSQSNLNDFLKRYGVEVKQNIIQDESYTPVSGYVAYPYWVLVQYENINHDIPVLTNLSSATMFWGSSVSEFELDNDLNFTKILQSTELAWETTGETVSIGFENITVPQERARYTLSAMVDGKFTSYYKGKDVPALVTAEADKRPKDIQRYDESDSAKIVVIGDSDFITDNFYQGNEQNPVLFVNMVDWMTNNSDLLEIRAKNIVTRPITPLINSEKIFIRIVTTVMAPIAVIATGTAFNIWRKKRSSILN